MADENTIRAGRITGNPLNGLCDRVVIEVARVFDGCVSRFTNRTFIVNLTNFEPAGLVYPYTYNNAMSRGAATFEDVVVTQIDARRARVQGNVIIPITVSFTDSQGTRGTAQGTITLFRDLILNTPARSLTQYTVSVTASMASDVGTFINETTVNIACCIVIVTKIIVMTDIVIPSYGQSVYPVCEETEDDLCNNLLNLPLFPPLE